MRTYHVVTWPIGIVLALPPLGMAASALPAQVPAKPATAAAQADPIILQLVEAHNKERAKENLPPLKFEAKLGEAALGHARDMAERQVMSHEGGDGSTFSQRVVRAGYHYQNTGENVAQGYKTIEEVMQGWMDSPPHRKNILGKFTEVGLAKVEDKDGRPYWCADFATPLVQLAPAEATSGLLKRINDERTKEKLPLVAVDTRLAKAAETIAAELAKSKGKGETPAAFQEIDQKKFVELAMTNSVGQPDPDTLINGLLEKPDYKARLLGKYSKVGIGYATDDAGLPYWTLILAIPSNR